MKCNVSIVVIESGRRNRAINKAEIAAAESEDNAILARFGYYL